MKRESEERYSSVCSFVSLPQLQQVGPFQGGLEISGLTPLWQAGVWINTTNLDCWWPEETDTLSSLWEVFCISKQLTGVLSVLFGEGCSS